MLGKTYEGSPLFVYENGPQANRRHREFWGWNSHNVKTLRRYGAPPEDMNPYSDQRISEIPRGRRSFRLLTRVGRNGLFQARRIGLRGTVQTRHVEIFPGRAIPIALGFAVPRSATRDAVIPYRPAFDSYRGGQTVWRLVTTTSTSRRKRCLLDTQQLGTGLGRRGGMDGCPTLSLRTGKRPIFGRSSAAIGQIRENCGAQHRRRSFARTGFLSTSDFNPHSFPSEL